jgi:hypothetical protein
MSGDKMADFYPLISKAVAGVTSGESRQALYERVRAALLSELRVADPPFSEFQIMHERLALEDAVRKVEEEATPTGDKLADAEHSAADADDTGIGVEIPWMIVTGSATGRLDRVWRLNWAQSQRPSA